MLKGCLFQTQKLFDKNVYMIGVKGKAILIP